MTKDAIYLFMNSDLKNPLSLDTSISLQAILPEDSAILLELMKTIYTEVYAHMWEDDGKSYLNNTYSAQQLSKELSEEQSHYYFIMYEEVIVGILRWVEALPLQAYSSSSGLKLHRLYLAKAVHGKGIGKNIIDGLVAYAKYKSISYIWLESMDSQEQALKFYGKMGFNGVEFFQYPMLYMKTDYRGAIRMVKALRKNDEDA